MGAKEWIGLLTLLLLALVLNVGAAPLVDDVSDQAVDTNHDDLQGTRVEEGVIVKDRFISQDQFEVSESVYARIHDDESGKKWCDKFGDKTVYIYIVPNTEWKNGMKIPDEVTEPVKVKGRDLCSDKCGGKEEKCNNNGVEVWPAKLKVGEFDIVVDTDEKHTYNSGKGDLVDSKFKTFGFQVLPEAGTLVLLGAGLVGVVGYLRIIKH